MTSKLADQTEEQESAKSLRMQLEEERKNYEDLLFNLEEEKIAKGDLQSQVDTIVSSDDRLKEKETELVELRSKLEANSKQLLQVTAELTKKSNELEHLLSDNKHLKECIENHETTEIRLQAQVEKLQQEVIKAKNEHEDFIQDVYTLEINRMNKIHCKYDILLYAFLFFIVELVYLQVSMLCCLKKEMKLPKSSLKNKPFNRIWIKWLQICQKYKLIT